MRRGRAPDEARAARRQAALDQAAVGQLSFLEPGHALAAALAGCGASALLIPQDPELQEQATAQGLAWVALRNPRLAFAEALDALYPRQRPAAGACAWGQRLLVLLLLSQGAAAPPRQRCFVFLPARRL